MLELEKLAWLILLAPLVSAAVIAIFTRNNPRASGQISISAVLVCFGLTLVLVLFSYLSSQPSLPRASIAWLTVPKNLHLDYLELEIGLQVDQLSLMMMLVVTGVGGLIHIYSWEYMRGDRGYSRYFAFLSLFTFSMLGIVLADNFLMMFIFWELVGVSSYLLIGFWYERPSAADACKKAFITNRLGDFGFLLGILMVWSTLGALNFGELKLHLASYSAAFAPVATDAGLLIFCGAVG